MIFEDISSMNLYKYSKVWYNVNIIINITNMKIEDIIRKVDGPHTFKRRQESMANDTIVIVIPDFSERETEIKETVERIWESFTLEEKTYVLEQVGSLLI